MNYSDTFGILRASNQEQFVEVARQIVSDIGPSVQPAYRLGLGDLRPRIRKLLCDSQVDDLARESLFGLVGSLGNTQDIGFLKSFLCDSTQPFAARSGALGAISSIGSDEAVLCLTNFVDNYETTSPDLAFEARELLDELASGGAIDLAAGASPVILDDDPYIITRKAGLFSTSSVEDMSHEWKQMADLSESPSY